MNRRKRWLGRLVLATLVPWMLVELILQLGAAWTAFAGGGRAAGDDAVTSGEASDVAVLCVGDSYTFGLGVSSPEHAYPVQLESELRGQPIEGRWRVVNGGRPGRNSSDVLRHLKGQVEKHHPRFVCVLVGLNDIWSRPKRITMDAASADGFGAAPTFEWRWRTWRLLTLLWRASDVGNVNQTPEPAAADSPFVGEWSSEQGNVEFMADGSMKWSEESMQWKLAGGELVLTRSDRSATHFIHKFSADGERLSPVEPGSHGRLTLTRMKPRAKTVSMSKLAADQYAAGDYEASYATTTRWLEQAPNEPWAHNNRLRAAVRLSLNDVVASELDAMRKLRDEKHDQNCCEALAMALITANCTDEAANLAHEDLARFPKSPLLWNAIQRGAERRNDLDAAEEALNHVFELSNDDSSSATIVRLRDRALLRSKRGDGAGAMRDILRAYAIEKNDAKLVQMVNVNRDALTEALIDPCAPEAGLTDEERQRAHELFADAIDPNGGGAPAVLAAHLRELAAFCRAHGAEPVILTYPFAKPEVELAQHEAAKESGARLVDLRPRFDGLLKTRKRSELFVADGHCSDAGYEEIAQCVAEALRGTKKAQ